MESGMKPAAALNEVHLFIYKTSLAQFLHLKALAE